MKRALVTFIILLILCCFSIAQEATDYIASSSGDKVENPPQPALISNPEEATIDEIQQIEDSAIDAETEQEIEVIFESTNGAKLRVLQLQKAATISYITASHAISILSEDEKDTTELESLLEEIKLLKNEADSLDFESTDVVDDFVNIKRDIKDLNKKFRLASARMLLAYDRQSIRNIPKSNQEVLQIANQIREANNELNAQRVQMFLEKIGALSPSLIEGIKLGEVTKAEIRPSLIDFYKNLSPAQKQAARKKLSDSMQSRNELRNMLVEKVRLEHISVREERLYGRLSRIPSEKRSLAEKRITAEIAVLRKVQAKLQEIRGDITQRVGEIDYDIKSRTQELRQQRDNLQRAGGKQQ